MAQAKKVEGKKVRYAIVGIGWISQAAMLPGVAHTGNSEVVAFVTGHEEKAQKVAEKYDVHKIYSYDELDQLLASDTIDAVYLATPNFDHVEYAVNILEAGIHLLLEKPMAVSVAECERIIAAQKTSGAKLMVAYRMHFEPGTLKAIERVRKGDFGTLRYFNSSFSQPVSGQNHRAKHGFWAGPVPDMGPYPLNMVRQLFGAEPIEVSALGLNTDPERFHDEAGNPFDDTVSVSLKFDAGRIAAFTVSYNGGDIDEYRVTGTKGTLSSNPAFQVGQGIKHTTLIDKVESNETFKTTDHFGGELKYFSECIFEDHNPEPDGEEGMLDVRVLAAIEESLKTGTAVKLAPYHRSRRPNPKQVQTLDKVSEPELIASHKPSNGQ